MTFSVGDYVEVTFVSGSSRKYKGQIVSTIKIDTDNPFNYGVRLFQLDAPFSFHYFAWWELRKLLDEEIMLCKLEQ